MDPLHKEHGIAIRQKDMASARKLRGYSQRWVSREMRIRTVELAGYENGKLSINMKHAKVWCEVLDLTQKQSDRFMLSCGLCDFDVHKRTVKRLEFLLDEHRDAVISIKKRYSDRTDVATRTVKALTERIVELEGALEFDDRVGGLEDMIGDKHAPFIAFI